MEEEVFQELFTAGFDGSCIPNPGQMTIGGWIRNSQGKVIYSFNRKIGKGTNNIAEYQALLTLLKEALKLNIKRLHIIGDSLLVVNQVNGVHKTRDFRMTQFKKRILHRLSNMSEWKIEHVLRNKNSEADKLTR